MMAGGGLPSHPTRMVTLLQRGEMFKFCSLVQIHGHIAMATYTRDDPDDKKRFSLHSYMAGHHGEAATAHSHNR